MNRFKKRLILFMCFIMLACSSFSVSAMTHIDLDKKVSLTIDLKHGDVVIPDAKFSLYYLAEVNANATFTLTERFSGYPIVVNNQSYAGWKYLSETLKGYVASDGLEADYVGSTDENGLLTFSNLKPGLYFVLPEKQSAGSYIYNIEPTIVCLPNLVDDVWDYDPTIMPKSTREDPLTEIKVIKAWKDEGAEKNRPRDITIELLMGREVYEEVVLNSDNNWTYIFNELPEYDESRKLIDWSVSEKEVKDYTVSIEREENVFVVTNTYINPPHDVPELPNTGQLWWPVPVLALSGLFMLALGTMISRKKNS